MELSEGFSPFKDNKEKDRNNHDELMEDAKSEDSDEPQMNQTI